MNNLSVVILNPDHCIAPQIQQDIAQQLMKNKIHIALIQETNIPRNLNYERNGYRIITSAATPKPKTPHKMTHKENT